MRERKRKKERKEKKRRRKKGECAACSKYSVPIFFNKYIKCNLWRLEVR
jgi:hypothetical protein